MSRDHVDALDAQPFDPMGELARSEAAWDHGDKPWFQYVAACERALGIGHDQIDRTEAIEGYSLDSCYEAYRVAISPADYAKGRRAQPGDRIVRR